MKFADRTMRQYLERFPEDDQAAKSYPWDLKRLARTLEWMADLRPQRRRILELGRYTIASYVIQQRYRENTFFQTTTDLRQPLPYEEEAFDIVLNMEVIEHVADIEYAHATVLSGVRHCLAEIRRVLRTGGYMLLTTPNACSLLVIERALRGEPPWQYPFHFREFSPTEIQILVEQAGFHIRKCRTEYVWSAREDHPALAEFLRQNRFDCENRGDDIFLVAQKTNVLPKPRGSLALPIPGAGE